MPHKHIVDDVEVVLDDDVDPAELDQGDVSRAPDDVDLDELIRQAEADAYLEDDTAEPIDDDYGDLDDYLPEVSG